jgi:hypothetical protein
VSLVCPSCGRAHGDDERFCVACGVPLVVEGGPVEAVVSERAARARKIKPQYSEGELVRVAIGRQQAEAELIQNLLLEQGVPSTTRRTRGFDVPEMLFAGPRDVLVPQSGEEVAREILNAADRRFPREPTPYPKPVRWVAIFLVLIFVVGFAAWIVNAIVG